MKVFPKETDPGEIIEFLILSGLSKNHMDNILIKPNGTVIINNLLSTECLELIAAIHNKTNFGRRLYCNGIVPLTPAKPEQQPDAPPSSAAPSPGSSPAPPLGSTGADAHTGTGHQAGNTVPPPVS